MLTSTHLEHTMRPNFIIEWDTDQITTIQTEIHD